MNARVLWILGMLSSIAGVFVGDMALPEPWNHRLMILSALSAALTGYMVQHPPPAREVWTEDERNDHRLAQGLPPAPIARP